MITTNKVAATVLTTGKGAGSTSLLKTAVSGSALHSSGSVFGLGVSVASLSTVLLLLAGSATAGYYGYRFVKSTIGQHKKRH